MTAAPLPPLFPDRVRGQIGWFVTFVVLVLGSFKFPNLPAADLDPSWRMALGYFSTRGMQFGAEVVFTYGPLGFIMSNTYSGAQWWGLILGQAALALVSAAVITSLLRRLDWRTRLVSVAYFFMFGVSYEDAQHMIVISILGFELLRRVRDGFGTASVLSAAVLSVYAQIKFTDFLLSVFTVAVVCVYALRCRRTRFALAFTGSFLGVFLLIWVIAGQSLPNLLPYLRSSWEISQGYQDAMGIPTPRTPLILGMIVLVLLALYALAHLWWQKDRARAIANVALLGAFTYLNWKHGFVRADGHMIGFFFCALLPLTSYPALFEDGGFAPRLHKAAFLVGVFIALWGIEAALFGVVRQSLFIFQDRVVGNIEKLTNWDAVRLKYTEALQLKTSEHDLHQIREIVGNASIDVIGFEQGVALFNHFNYHPRPVIQSYSTFTSYLSHRNEAFYLSDRAPEYVLVKVQTLDERAPMMDDAFVMNIIVRRYDYVTSEKGFQLWKRNPGPFDPSVVRPTLQRTHVVKLGEPHSLADLAGKPVWLNVDVGLSWWGKVRRFFYKPSIVTLALKDQNGARRTYRLPLPIGRTGFLVSPMVEEPVGFVQYAANRSQRLVHQVAIEVDPADRANFKGDARLSISTLPPSNSGRGFFTNVNQQLFHMFKTYPIAYEAHTGVSEQSVEGKDLAILHAPSKLTFELPSEGVSELIGEFGFLPNAYQNGGKTNGAEFSIVWQDGSQQVELLKRYLDPFGRVEDRGLQPFKLKLNGLKGGHLYFRIGTGPYNDNGWDWTGWTGIQIR